MIDAIMDEDRQKKILISVMKGILTSLTMETNKSQELVFNFTKNQIRAL